MKREKGCIYILAYSKFYWPDISDIYLPLLIINDINKADNHNNKYQKNNYSTIELDFFGVELSIIYNIYKNEKKKFYGFCDPHHYFNFEKYNNNIYSIEEMPEKCFSNDLIDNLFKEFDVILPQLKKINNVTSCQSDIDKLYMILLFLVKEKKINKKTLDKIFKKKYFFSHRMFIMKEKIFHNYCEWLLSILDFLLNNNIFKDNFNKNKDNILLFDILFTIYFELFLKNKNIFYSGITHIEYIHEKYYIEYKNYSNDINIAICVDNNFVKFAYLLILSLKKFNYKKKVNIFLFVVDVFDIDKNRFFEMIDQKMYIRFIDGQKYLKKRYSTTNRLGQATYLRFGIFDCLKNFEKILYLDADTIINGNIEELYDYDIEKYFLAATRDYAIISKFKDKSSKYFYHCYFQLKLNKPHNYFNSGVLLINLKKINDKFNYEYFLEMAAKNEFLFQDQDILNICFHENVFFLENKWNFFANDDEEQKNNFLNLPEKYYNDYIFSKNNPIILHFTNSSSPCFAIDTIFSDIWWKLANCSPYYHDFLYLFYESKKKKNAIKKNNNINFIKKINFKIIKKVIFKYRNDEHKYIIIKRFFYKKYLKKILKK